MVVIGAKTIDLRTGKCENQRAGVQPILTAAPVLARRIQNGRRKLFATSANSREKDVFVTDS